MRLKLTLVLASVLVWSCSGFAQGPTPELVAQQIAAEYLVDRVRDRLNLPAGAYASPVPTDIPIAVLVAAAVYDSAAELFRLRVEEAKFYLETAKGMMTDKDLGPVQVRNAVRGAQAGLTLLQTSDGVENLETARYERLRPALSEIVTASERLVDAPVVEGLLRLRVKEALAQQADLYEGLSARRSVSAPLRTARTAFLASVKKTPK